MEFKNTDDCFLIPFKCCSVRSYYMKVALVLACFLVFCAFTVFDKQTFFIINSIFYAKNDFNRSINNTANYYEKGIQIEINKSTKDTIQKFVNGTNATSELVKQYCDYLTSKLEEKRKLNLSVFDENIIEELLKSQNIENGGCWKPKDCKAKSRLAVVIPYRNRLEHLRQFLLNMHPLFAKQQLMYCIYVIEPIEKVKFNRGILMNIGFVESNNDSNHTWQCHVYHDVDLLSENEYTSYHCPDNPYHLAERISKHGYKPLYEGYFGGASLMKKEHFIKANGYSNLFFGWGGEDDDHGSRIRNAGLKIDKPSPNSNIGVYYMLSHDQDTPNPRRFELLNKGKSSYNIEGLNTLKYTLIKKEKTALYTKILVNYNDQF